MARRTPAPNAKVIRRIVALVDRQVSRGEADTAAKFVKLFLADMPAADIETTDPHDIASAALSFWKFARDRRGNTAKIRAFNPHVDQDDWTLSHTVVEIVITNSPFLVSSLTVALNQLGLTVHLIAHPMARVVRDGNRLIELTPSQRQRRGSEKFTIESFIHFHIDQRVGAGELREIERRLTTVLKDVGTAVADWSAMRGKIAEAINDIDRCRVSDLRDEVDEARSFLEWIVDDNFTLLGYREYRFSKRRNGLHIKSQSGALGLMRSPDQLIFENWHDGKVLPPQASAYLARRDVVAVTKSHNRSGIHRSAFLDVIGVKIFNANGRVCGERFIVGLFTSAAYSLSPFDVPILARKLRHTESLPRYDRTGHNFKALVHILENYPRDELFQIDEDTLLANAKGILDLQERQHVAVFMRRDIQGRFVSMLVYVPRERFNTPLRLRIAEILEEILDGTLVDFTPEFSAETMLVRVLYVIKTGHSIKRRIDLKKLTARLTEATRNWEDRLEDALLSRHGRQAGMVLRDRFRGAFGSGYQDNYDADETVDDIDCVEAVAAGSPFEPRFYRRPDDPPDLVRLKLYHPDASIPLSDVIPMLENMGLKVVGEIPNAVRLNQGESKQEQRKIWIHDFAATLNGGSNVNTGLEFERLKQNFQDAFIRVFQGDTEDDGFNRLIIETGLAWRQIVILRAICKFLLQARIAYSQAYMEASLAANPVITRLIVLLFETRFDPDWQPASQKGHRRNNSNTAFKKRQRAVQSIIKRIGVALDSVASLDEDRILRRFVNVVEAILRTNHFQLDSDGTLKSYLSFKVDGALAEGLPKPRPWVEVFVYAPWMEGCHLRGGAVARGGIRWSDRPEDFRTEILGLMKAQMVKNAVIVPTGAKGGFVVKQAAKTKLEGLSDELGPDEIRRQGIVCYRTLIRGLLDLTDNLAGGKVEEPPDTLRYDGADPYLVVAADKGTATFSDIANEISNSYGHWLGDAFASGGSSGYDHKKMGITARGAWESVKRHFRELGHDIQNSAFTAVGVGDMSGDVFGNGMLLSLHINLIGAFNHRHIFVDPKPNLAVGYKERQRLFRSGRGGGWSDYNTSLISHGGGVFDRRAKSIKVSREMAGVFSLTKETVTPAELITAILRAKVDLIWFGGIGTYVKAVDETDIEVDDRANDAVRINGTDLGARVVGEGANLGVTPLGRIEFARGGGRINADFVDNSGGVDCSDREVNIKIALNHAVETGRLTPVNRNKLLVQMTEDVASQVLNDNYLQAQAISQAMITAPQRLDAHWGLIRDLERAGMLDRDVEQLPDDEAMTERSERGEGLTRPEYALLLAYGKMQLYSALIASDVPDDPYCVRDLQNYFPNRLSRRFADQIDRHRLRREIIASRTTNSIVNRMGASFVSEIVDSSGAETADIARAYIAARNIFGLRSIWRQIEELDTKITVTWQGEMRQSLEKLVRRTTRWFLSQIEQPTTIAVLIDTYGKNIGELIEELPDLVTPVGAKAIEAQISILAGGGVPGKLARDIAVLEASAGVCDIALATQQSKRPIAEVAKLYFDLGNRFGLDWLRAAAASLSPASSWEKIAIGNIIDDGYAIQSELTARIARLGVSGRSTDTGAAIDAWTVDHCAKVGHTLELLGNIRTTPKVDLAMLSVFSRQAREMVVG